MEWFPLRCCPSQNPEERTWDLFLTIRATDRSAYASVSSLAYYLCIHVHFRECSLLFGALRQREHQLRKVARWWSS